MKQNFQTDPRILKSFMNRAGKHKPHFLKKLLENPIHLESTGDMKFHRGIFKGLAITVITMFEPSNPVKPILSGILWLRPGEKTDSTLEPYVKIQLDEVPADGLQLEVQDIQGDYFSQEFIRTFVEALIEALQQTEVK